MQKVTDLAKSLLPHPIKQITYNTRNRIRTNVSNKLWEILDLKWNYSDINIKIKSKADWIIYHEIFVAQVYDLAIQKSIESSNNSFYFNVLDLGANTGFFAVRVAHLLAKANKHDMSFRITCIEGSPLVYKELRSRIDNESVLREKVTTIQGLVGERKGSAKIFESSCGIGNSLFPRTIPEGVEVPFVDLYDLYDKNNNIDLLKCDIEGSELKFLENYKDLLSRVKVAVFEFHPNLCNVDKCYRIINEAGLANQKNLSHGSNPVKMFWK